MNEEFESDPGSNGREPRHNKESDSADGSETGRSARPHAPLNGHSGPVGVDAWTVADVLAQRWHWLVIGGILGGAALFMLGLYLVKPKFTAVAQLLRYETPGTSEALTGTPLTMETFSGLIVSPDLLRRIGEKVDPPIPPDRLVKQMKIDPQPESDLIKVFVAAGARTQAVTLANLYVDEVVDFTKDLQARHAALLAQNYLKKQLDQLDQDIAALQDQFRGLPAAGQVSNKLSEVSGNVNALQQNLAVSPLLNPLTMKLSEKLQTSLAELTELQSKYKDIHPFVQQKQAEIESLENQITNARPLFATGASQFALGPNGRALDPVHEIIGAKLNSMEYVRLEMANRQREADLYAQDPPGVVRVFAPATLKTVQSNHRRLKIGLVTIFGGFVGMGCSLCLVLLTELVDNRVKSVDDLRRVSRLPVLTTLGNLEDMRDSLRAQWAFRTWTMLQGRLSPTQNHGLVCGITSSTEGEGRSTWIRLLAEAASLSGFRVLTVATQPSSSRLESPNQITEETLDQAANMNTSNQNHALSHDVLSAPSRVTEQLTDPNSRPVVHIPLPGWVWNVDRRRQWGSALNQWRKIDNLVILVELPPASMPEAVLLGSNLPNLVWLADSGTAEAGETKAQLQTLRDARCNLVGAVLNREQSKPLKRRFSRWLGCALLTSAIGLTMGQAQTVPLPVDPPQDEEGAESSDTAPGTRPASFSVVSPEQRAAWQTNLTLGPGDVLTFALHGEPLLTQTEVPIAPDGRVSFLDARDIVATGLTVDELRARIDEALGEYRRVARCIITPVTYRSKKYFVLGKVMQKGVYVLDRPTTIIEALARAKGIESGVVENNTVDLADFSRAFLMRDGRRMEVDFEKLFQNGDLRQNIQVEPGDYLYFPPANVEQVYVLGEVSLPGPVTYRPDMTLIAALAYRGGFKEKAFKSRVLIVRGSLSRPETFVVDTMAITAGRNPDFKLDPKDIVYVTHRPFWRAEDLLDMATIAFLQAVVTTWVGTEVMPP